MRGLLRDGNRSVLPAPEAEETRVTPEEKRLIAASFARIESEAEAVAARFFHYLYDLDPSLRTLFGGMFRPRTAAHHRRFMAQVGRVIRRLHHADELVPLLWPIGKRHGGCGVREEHYRSMTRAALCALEDRLESEYTPELHAAWENVFGLMRDTLLQAASEGVTPAPPVPINNGNPRRSHFP